MMKYCNELVTHVYKDKPFRLDPAALKPVFTQKKDALDNLTGKMEQMFTAEVCRPLALPFPPPFLPPSLPPPFPPPSLTVSPENSLLFLFLSCLTLRVAREGKGMHQSMRESTRERRALKYSRVDYSIV